MERAGNGKYICPHNVECQCDIPECHKCGWNPEVAERRRKEFKSKLYKIQFTGYCEVYANSAEEAVQKADNGEMFFAHYDFDDPIRLEKEE